MHTLRSLRYLKEQKLDYYKNAGVSNITKKHYKIRLTKNYSYNLYEIVSVKDEDLRLIFDVIPTFKDNEPLPNNSGEKSKLHQYTVEIQFVHADKFGELDDLTSLSRTKLNVFWDNCIKNCDIKFYSDDPSFYWQGTWEDLAENNASIYPFKGKRGDHTWRKRHGASGGLLHPEIRITKHLAQILYDLDKYKDTIIQYLSENDLDYVE